MAKSDLDWVSVVSSNISAIAYDDDEAALFIEFRSGGTYSYDAPREEFENLRDSASPGGYFASNIKGQYAGRKL